MKKGFYKQPQTCEMSIRPQMVILGLSHESGESLPTNPDKPGGGGIGSPGRTLYV